MRGSFASKPAAGLARRSGSFEWSVPFLVLAAVAVLPGLSCTAKEGGSGAPAPGASPTAGGRREVDIDTEDHAERETGAAAATEAEAGPPFATEPSRDPVMKKLVRATGRSFAALDDGPYRLVVEGSEVRAETVAWRTVRPAVERLSRQFFVKAPRPGIRLVLFASDATYRKGAKALTGERPDTPYGFYSHTTSAVIMNLGTGGGTLVHELVHTFTETDFPDMPAWLNEGLASLYEQCRYGEGRLLGMTNWRLPDLQSKLRGGADGLLAKVVATSTDAFYGPGSGLHYAAARYLCFDLQEKGLLERFYRQFRGGHATDPTGRKTLEEVLGRTLDEYEPGWTERTLRLRFPVVRQA